MPPDSDNINALLEPAFDKFCTHFKMDPHHWKSIFEFVAMFGPGLSMRTGKANARAYLALKAYSGPHGDVLIQAYKVRRYSIRGRLGTPFLMLVAMSQYVVFLCLT